MEIYKKIFPEGEFQVFSDAPSFDLKKVKQVHGTKISTSNNEEADGLISKSDNLGILTADCMPILLLGTNGTSLIHAGWRGLHAGILKNVVLKSLKVREAFIGPHINNCCYEVTEEFLRNFEEKHFNVKKSKYYFSMNDVAMLQLKQIFGDIKISSSGECTCCNFKFHSFRRNKTVKRNWNTWKPNIIDTLHTTG